MREAKTANEAWIEMLRDIRTNGLCVDPRSLGTLELCGYQTCIDMTQPVVTIKNRIEGKYFGFMCAEAAWILSGDNRVATIAPYSRMIKRFSDDGRFFHGAYGPKIVDQISHVVNALIDDPDSRQAVINIWRENPRKTKDVPCTLSAQWMIRNETLHCFDTMRSSDAWLGWPFDVFNFSMLSHAIAILINEITGVPLQIGSLYLTAGSQHLYTHNLPKVDVCIDDPVPAFTANPLDSTQFKSMDELIIHLWDLAEIQIGKQIDFQNLHHTFLEELAAWES